MTDWKLDDPRLEELIEAVRRSAHDDGYHRLAVDNPSHETDEALIVLRDYIENVMPKGKRDGPAPKVLTPGEHRYGKIFELFERYTDEQRAECMYLLECWWCWSCGQSQTDHGKECPATEQEEPVPLTRGIACVYETTGEVFSITLDEWGGQNSTPEQWAMRYPGTKAVRVLIVPAPSAKVSEAGRHGSGGDLPNGGHNNSQNIPQNIPASGSLHEPTVPPRLGYALEDDEAWPARPADNAGTSLHEAGLREAALALMQASGGPSVPNYEDARIAVEAYLRAAGAAPVAPDLRQALAKLLRDVERFAADPAEGWRWRPDWACADCVGDNRLPNSPPDFRCARHAALKLLADVPAVPQQYATDEHSARARAQRVERGTSGPQTEDAE